MSRNNDRNNDRKSNVEVNVVDLSSVEKECYDGMKDKKDKLVGLKSNYTYGYVVTKKGVMVLCSEGVGSPDPVTKKIPLVIDLYPDYAPNADGSTSLSIFPIMGCKLDDKDILALPVIKKENLATFIRQFGSRLESNFRAWDKELSN